MLPAADRPASISTVDIVREELQRELQPDVPVDAAQKAPALTYTAVARRLQHPVAQHYEAPPHPHVMLHHCSTPGAKMRALSAPCSQYDERVDNG